MERILGLDLGTNSIGWAVVDRKEDNERILVDKGVHIFQDGVAHDKSGEKPAVQDRTAARASRRHYFRRRLRKIELLKVLVENQLCPPLREEDLDRWKAEKKYPMDPDFLEWQRTDDNCEKNPYHDRHVCLTRELDMKQKSERYILGRALYHLNQRRGFLSNRKDAVKNDDNGKVEKDITSLSTEMAEMGCEYLGEYFYHCYGKKKIRTRYTARDIHYRKEFEAICKKQGLSEPLVQQLERAIFFQRPLKSQKGTIGRCTFEKDKPRCPVSHPRFEEFRMWQFINSIRVNYMGEGTRPLNQSEIRMIFPLFFRKTKPDFDFNEIAVKMAGKGNYKCVDETIEVAYSFNYKMTSDVPGCPVIASLLSALGIAASPEWDTDLCSLYTRGEGKSIEQIINDIWHALFFFDDDKRLTSWLMDALQLDEKAATSIVRSRFPQGYASLSHKAIIKILPWLKKGLKYSDAVFMANLPATLPRTISQSKRDEVEENVRILLEDFDANPLNRESNKLQAVSDYLITTAKDVNTKKLYHPSMIDIYPKALPDASGKIRLGSPRTDAFKNPMALRALFRLRALINQLLDEGVIDKETKINIEFARGLNDTNKRKAIEDYQRELEKQRKEDRAKIIEACMDTFGKDYEPSDDDLSKYRLYEEQNHICLYTGKQIGLAQFLGAATEFDIEHTLPRSRGGDDSMMNKTLCDSHFNRFDKKAKLPSELANHDEIMQRISSWKDLADGYEKQIASWLRNKRNAASKEAKDSAIRRIHYLKMKRNYWKGKYERFVMPNVPDGFSNRQGVDIGIIGKYARMYLATVFEKIFVVKGATTADFRKAWGLQKDYVKKARTNHAHHCIDAITIACIGKNEYDTWKEYMLREENYMWGNGKKPDYQKPWKTFTEDVLRIPNQLLVSHYTPDNMAKKSRKKMRVRGIIQRNEVGEIKYCQGDTARGLLHLDTVYGAIKRDEEVKYVVRKALDSLEEKDIKNIVDDVVRKKVKTAYEQFGSLKKAVEKGIWMKENVVPIKKVRLFASSITNPIHLKRHRDVSTKEYKRSTYVANDSNYCMAIYGDVKPSFKLYSIMDTVQYFKKGLSLKDWIPTTDGQARPLRCILKIGTMVLLYQSSPQELYNCPQDDLVKRLYKVVGLSSSPTKSGNRIYLFGRATLRFHQEARLSSELKEKKGVWTESEDYRAIIGLSHNQLNCLVEGIDFELSTTGRVSFKA